MNVDSKAAGPTLKLQASMLAGAVIAGVLVVSGLVALPAISEDTPFFTRGEPREALVVQTIARGEGFVLPMRNGDELPSKPPLFHWLAALASLLHGRVTEGSIRIPGLLASLLAMAATAWAAWRWWGAATAALATVVLATSFQWLASSVSARVDMVLAAAITGALVLFARAIETGRRIPAAAYALLVAATLTKGPVGLVLPCAIAMVTLVLRGELRFLGWRDLRLLGLATGAIAVWYAAAWMIGGEAFIAKQVLKENVFRVLDAEAVDAGHVEAFWYYVPLLAAGLAPWSLFIPGLAIFAIGRRDASAFDGGGASAGLPPAAESAPTGGAPDETVVAYEAPGFSRYDSPNRFDPHTTFALIWGCTTFLLFSVAGSKRAVYLLPAYPAYAMLLASSWTRVFASPPVGAARAALLAGALTSTALLGLVGVILLAAVSGLPLEDQLRGIVSNADANNVAPMLAGAREHRALVAACGLATLLAAWFTARSSRRSHWQGVVAATAVATFVLSTTVSTTLLPALAAKRSTRGFLARVEQQVPATTPLSFYRAFDYGAVFYRGEAIPLRSSLADVPEIDGAWLLTWPAFLPDLAEEARKLDTGGEAAGAYEVEEVLASEDVGPSDRSSLVLVRIVRRIGDERSDGN
ncbi:MAG: glycosyltransferase family 39 protein [Candidatus Binatia bacterium]